MDRNNLASSPALFWTLINALLIIAITFGVVGTASVMRSSNAVIPSRTITVAGEGKISVAPDIATVSFAVVSQGTNPELIQQANTEKINKAIALVKAQGVTQKDITTTGYNLYPRYRYDKDNGESSISGYELNQTVTLKIRDLTKVSVILAGLPGAGVNNISSLTFSVDDPELMKRQAREEAFADAYSKARSMAKQNGVQIARVISFSESGDNYPIFYRDAVMGKGGGEGAPMPTIEPGSQDLTSRVSVTYEIR